MNLFVALDALLETRSVTQAAERLNIGVSAASSALGRLREHFRDELLVRVGGRMDLTPLATSLRNPVRDVIVRSEATLAAKTDFDARSERRRFVFNASDYAATVLLAPLARRLEREAPGITIDIVGLFDSNLQRLERGDIDFAIYPARDASSKHPQEKLLDEHYSCVVWSEYPLQAGAIAFDTYMAARHVAVQTGNRGVPTFEGWFLATHGVPRNIVVTTSSFVMLPSLLIGTERIATMHTRLARYFEDMFPIRVVPVPFEIPALEIVAQWNSHKERDVAHRWVRQQLMEIAALA